MKLNLRTISALSSVAAMLFAVGTAKADTLNVSIWANGTTGNVPANNAAGNQGIYGTTPTITLTVTNSDPTAILNWYSSNDNNLTTFLTTGANYNAGGMVTSTYSNGDAIAYLTGANQTSTDGSAIDNDLFQITGSVTLTNGTYTYEHDDGMMLYLNGSAVINAPGPTSAVPTSFTVCASGCDATAGAYSFILDYAEVDGKPAALKGDLPFTAATPEPSSFLLLGSSLFGAAGVLRRRMKKS